ncbi:hypothetical protein SDC9_21417 [bioreactor metagenome]|uniref:Uncharacterized protein n=1 Tax=bioreactor metagenome TaxID=1076179 RepID=A0A644U9H1_9ZZZZ|nr:hypothetical protein [Methanobrevibacter sp.]MEA4956758.1 hypothetical protein [Methanobrevibacter sp.]
MKKYLLIILITLLIGSISAVMADNGTLESDRLVILNESGNNVSYNAVCIDEERSIYIGSNVSTKENITTRDGVINYIVNNWYEGLNETENFTEFQNGIWNLSQNTSLPFKQYPDNYKQQRVHEYQKITTQQNINGSLYNVTKWTEIIDTFTFRMTGDGWGVGVQDLMIFLFDSQSINHTELTLIPNDVNNNTTNNTTNNNTNNNTNSNNKTDLENKTKNATNIYEDPNLKSNNVITDNITTSANMRETGIPIIAAILVLLASIGVLARKK